MGERTTYTTGTFCWVDLDTTDPGAAASFYSGLLGWTVEQPEAHAEQPYAMASRDGHYVAAIAPLSAPEAEQGVPPHWDSYVKVDSAEATAQRARELGGSVLAAPFAVGDAGRMAIVSDPTGAVFLLWEPGQFEGAGLVNAPGALNWNELATHDPEAAVSFYEALFAWDFEQLDTGGGPDYWTIRNRGAVNGGMRRIGSELPPEAPAHWLPYFAVQEAADALARTAELGGHVMAEPIEVPAGRFAVAADPQGAVFALFSGDLDP